MDRVTFWYPEHFEEATYDRDARKVVPLSEGKGIYAKCRYCSKHFVYDSRAWAFRHLISKHWGKYYQGQKGGA